MKKPENVEVKVKALERLEKIVGKFEDDDGMVAAVAALKSENDKLRLQLAAKEKQKKVDIAGSTVAVPEIGGDGTTWFKYEVSVPEPVKLMVEQASAACSVTPKQFITTMLVNSLQGMM